MNEVANPIVDAINQYGFPIIAAMGLGYFVYFIWKWVTDEIDPVIGDTKKTLIELVDRIRMLDNDMIRLNTKLSMVLEYYGKHGQIKEEDVQAIVDQYASISKQFNQTKVQEKNLHRQTQTQQKPPVNKK